MIHKPRDLETYVQKLLEKLLSGNMSFAEPGPSAGTY